MLVGGALLLAGCGGEQTPVRLGVALSIREPGVAPAWRAAQLAAREINAAGGIKGRQLELVVRDDHGSSDSAVVVATGLYESDVAAVIGPAYSSLTLASAPVYNGGRRPVVQLSPSASSPSVTRAGDYTFRLCPSDLAYGAALAQFAGDRGLLRAAVLYVNDEYGRGMRQTFASEFSRLGGEVLELDPFLASSPDVGPYLARIARERRAQVIVLAANQSEGLPVLRQIRAARLGLPILAGDGMVGAERTDPVLMEGVMVASGYIPGTATEANRRFVSAYRQAFPRAGSPDQGAAATYDAVYLLARLVGEVGTDRDRLRDALASVGRERPAYEGVVGGIVFDADGDVPTLKVRIGVAQGGDLVPAS